MSSSSSGPRTLDPELSHCPQVVYKILSSCREIPPDFGIFCGSFLPKALNCLNCACVSVCSCSKLFCVIPECLCVNMHIHKDITKNIGTCIHRDVNALHLVQGMVLLTSQSFTHVLLILCQQMWCFRILSLSLHS